MTRLRAVLAICIAAAAVAVAEASASDPATLSFLDVSVRSTPAFDASQGEPRPGDRVFLTDALYAWHGARRGARAGSIASTLTFMSPFGRHGATVDLSGQLFLHGGSLRVDGVVQVLPDRTTSFCRSSAAPAVMPELAAPSTSGPGSKRGPSALIVQLVR